MFLNRYDDVAIREWGSGLYARSKSGVSTYWLWYARQAPLVQWVLQLAPSTKAPSMKS